MLNIMAVKAMADEIVYESLLAELFSQMNIINYLILSLFNAILLLLVSPKFLQIMQQSGYEGLGYFKWLRRRDNIYLTRLINLSMLSLLGFLLFNIFFSFLDRNWGFYVGFIFYFAFIIRYANADKKLLKKKPLVFTARMKRLCVVYFILLYLASAVIIFLSNYLVSFASDNSILIRVRFALICLTPIIVPIMVTVAHYVMKPYENKVQKRYIKITMAKLHERSDCIKIGITGSYGKTTVKEILKTILLEKYNVLATPSSFNTPMGICRTVKKLKPEHQVFIAEMGARHVGDIKELAEIVKPDYAIIGGIVGQHLETFGSLESIQKTKYELVQSMKKGVVAYTVDSENTSVLFRDCLIKSVPCGTKLDSNPEVYAKDIIVDSNGSTFTLVIGDEQAKCHTVLLGKHNVSNICLASAIAHEMGLSISEISAGIGRLTQVKHRLELIKSERLGITIIDDSYNANVTGIECALQVLNSFDTRKIIITPGLVELGATEDIENYRFGKKIAKVCDIAILIGKSSAFRMQDGLIDAGFNIDNAIIAKSLNEAVKKYKKIMQNGDVLLFENDLPDKFS